MPELNLTKYEEFVRKTRSLHCPADKAAGKVVKAISVMDVDRDGYILIGYEDGTYTQLVAVYEDDFDNGNVCVHKQTTSPLIPYSPHELHSFIEIGLVTKEEVDEMIQEQKAKDKENRHYHNIVAYRALYEQFGGAHPDEIK